MPDYSDPVVWATYLENNQAHPSTRQPSIQQLAVQRSDEELEQFLQSHLNAHDPIRFGCTMSEANKDLDDILYGLEILP
jgi:hypothetical protein